MGDAAPIASRKICPALPDANSSGDTVVTATDAGAVPAGPSDNDKQQLQSKPKRRSTISAIAMLRLSLCARYLLWIFILVYQLLNAILLTCLAVMYGSVRKRDTVLWFLRYNFLFSAAQQFLTDVHPYVCAGYALLATVFAHGALSMLWHSIRRRRFCYTAAPSSSPSQAPNKHNIPTATHKRSTNVVVHYVLNGVTKLVLVHRSFGLRGRYFSIGFFVREVIESVLQSIQALQSSRSLSNVFVNQSYGVLIFLNCFICVALPQLYRSQMATRGRFVCVLADLALDFVWGSIIPLVVFWPYLRMFHAYLHDAYEYVPVENVQREVEFILVMSTSDFILSTFPFMSSAANMRSVKRLLVNLDDSAHDGAVVVVAPAGTSKDTQMTSTTAEKRLGCIDRVCAGTCTRKRCEQFCHGLFLVYGAAILAISVASMSQSSYATTSPAAASFTCLNRVYPWLSTKEACVGRIIDCSEAGVSGSRIDLAGALLQYDESTLSNLVFTKCAYLEVPPEIRRFRHLQVLTIRDSEIHEWTADAALTADYYSVLQTIRFANVTLHSEPEGFGVDPLPPSVEWLSLTDVNIASVVDRVDDKWQHVKYFYCDSCSLTSFPTAVNSMAGLLELSLIANAIEEIDDTDVAHLASVENLWIDGTPLVALPDALWHICSSLSDFSIQHTNVSHIPDWVEAHAGSALRLFAFGTPLCADEHLATRPSFLHCEEVTY